MSILRINVKDKERRLTLKRTWIEHGFMYIEATTGEMFKRSLKYFPTDRIGWERYNKPSPLPNPAVMGADNYFVYCAAYAVSFAPNKPKKDGNSQRHDVWNMSWASPIVFG